MKAILLSLVSLAIVGTSAYYFSKKGNDSKMRNEFENFKRTYDKSYGSEEENYRFNVFKNNYNYIQTKNLKQKDTVLGVNKFADLTFDEFKNMYLGFRLFRTNEKREFKINEDFNQYSATLDWTLKGKVSPVKNQGQCGSCWSFSTTGALESYLRIFENKSPLLSEQELVDCSGSYGNFGCGGGLMSSAYNYIKDHGLTSESLYPYEASDDNCRSSQKKRIVSANTYSSKNAFSEYKSYKEVQKVLQSTPVAVALEATQDFQLYNGGVLKVDSSCGDSKNHGVLLVGYGVENNQTYTKIKNSWGPSWGESGYIRITFDDGQSDSCGITSSWSQVVVKA